mmetsp:Transcript_16738/g.34077  ORF Transcript_16738/g.34077 Transcript_16738/m.34077 type:complete len:153 (+) Transcript_16738:1154-1612(+)
MGLIVKRGSYFCRGQMRASGSGQPSACLPLQSTPKRVKDVKAAGKRRWHCRLPTQQRDRRPGRPPWLPGGAVPPRARYGCVPSYSEFGRVRMRLPEASCSRPDASALPSGDGPRLSPPAVGSLVQLSAESARPSEAQVMRHGKKKKKKKKKY